VETISILLCDPASRVGDNRTNLEVFMKTKRFLTKGLLLTAFMAFILVSCSLDENAPVVDPARAAANAAEAVPAHNVDAADARNVDTSSYEIFGDVKIQSSEYLYKLNDSPDYIYVDFKDYGYVVYSQWGLIPRARLRGGASGRLIFGNA
jgi:hypothetical protein